MSKAHDTRRGLIRARMPAEVATLVADALVWASDHDDYVATNPERQALLDTAQRLLASVDSANGEDGAR